MNGQAGDNSERRRRNLAVGLALGAFVVLIFAITVVRLKDQVISPWFDRPEVGEVAE